MESFMKIIVLLGRILYSAIFILAMPGHFMQHTIDLAKTQSIPAPEILVPLSGLIALIGGLSVLLGYKAKEGAWLLVIFLVTATFSMHRYWMFDDLIVRDIQQLMFMKNLALLGGALLITYFGSGPLSMDNHARKAPKTKKR
jgi:putative oxidoreductase